MMLDILFLLGINSLKFSIDEPEMRFRNKTKFESRLFEFVVHVGFLFS